MLSLEKLAIESSVYFKDLFKFCERNGLTPTIEYHMNSIWKEEKLIFRFTNSYDLRKYEVVYTSNEINMMGFVHGLVSCADALTIRLIDKLIEEYDIPLGSQRQSWETTNYNMFKKICDTESKRKENMEKMLSINITAGLMNYSTRTTSIKKVIFNDPATIVLWTDGSKTIVKCGENDIYDPEKGLAMCITKKVLGNKGNYYNEIKKWLPDESEKEGACKI